MLDDFLDVLCMFDLVDRADEIVGTMIFGPAHCFHIRRVGGWTGYQVEQLLARHGVRIWGRGFTPGAQGILYFSVKVKQSNWAEYIMMRCGVPLVSKDINPRNSAAFEKHAGVEPPAWRFHTEDEKRQQKGGWLSKLF